ncbi:MAG: hypothetical protein IKP35_01795 [Alphaproteobacteria bacterium]|nr:hypothetical protein [Alphaproteobacteria bacterium]
MTQRTKIQKIKLFIKISIVFVVCTIFVVLGFFVKPIRTFENSHMKKWTMLAEQDRLMTIQRVIPNAEDQDLLMNCITKISNLPNSNEMIIRDAVVLCYNGIKFNKSINTEAPEEVNETDEK